MVNKILTLLNKLLAKILHVSTKASMPILKTLLLVAVVTTVSLKAPELHKKILRDYVGSKVVLVANMNTVEATARGEKSSVSGGTGFHIKAPSGKTYIITNRHVCDIVEDNFIYVNIDNEPHLKKIIKRDDNTDLCLIEPINEVDGMELSDDDLEAGQGVATIGHPSLQPMTFTRGDVVGPQMAVSFIGIIIQDDALELKSLVSSLTQKRTNFVSKADCSKYKNRKARTINMNAAPLGGEPLVVGVEICEEFIEGVITTVPIYQGSSGSPVVNFWGNAVGVMYAVGKEGFWGRLIPVKDIKRLLKGM